MESIEALVRRAQACDASLAQRHGAFGTLVTRFQDTALGHAYALLGHATLAEDAAQEAFLAAYRQLGDLRDPAAFPGWLRRIVLTYCRRLTRGKQYPATSLAMSGDPASSVLDPSAVVEERELQRMLRVALQSLPEHERVAALLYYVGRYPQAEIATLLGVPPTTVKKRLQYARERLRDRELPRIVNGPREKPPSRDERFVRRIRFLLIGEAFAADGQRRVDDVLALDGVGTGRDTSDLRLLRFDVAQTGYRALLELLLVDGIDVNDEDADGRSPLAWAAEYGSSEAIRILLAHQRGTPAVDSFSCDATETPS